LPLSFAVEASQDNFLLDENRLIALMCGFLCSRWSRDVDADLNISRMLGVQYRPAGYLMVLACRLGQHTTPTLHGPLRSRLRKASADAGYSACY
jgi:hypothetical protein